MDKRLTIIAVEDENSIKRETRHSRKKTTEDKFDALWRENPAQFDPTRDCIQQERLANTLSLIEKYISLEGKKVVDLGCGSGVLARMMAEKGASVDAVDISKYALAALEKNPHEKVFPIQDLVPETKLDDDSYDIVVSTELIAYLPKEERRIYMAELSRLVKANGYIVCSTPIDIDTEGALQTFGDLLETEFTPVEWSFSYNALLIRVMKFFGAPEKFVKSYEDEKMREGELKKRKGFSHLWHDLNSSWPLGPFWKTFHSVFEPLDKAVSTNTRFMYLLGKVCRFFKSDAGISHVTFIGQRRPLSLPTQEELMAYEPKHKKQVWE